MNGVRKRSNSLDNGADEGQIKHLTALSGTARRERAQLFASRNDEREQRAAESDQDFAKTRGSLPMV